MLLYDRLLAANLGPFSRITLLAVLCILGRLLLLLFLHYLDCRLGTTQEVLQETPVPTTV